jgi:pimeloyl-ACP methyl ester carboxylesterase
LAATVPPVSAAEKIEGIWAGVLKVGAAELRLVFHVRADDAGKLTAGMESPDQGPGEIPVEKVAFEADKSGDKITGTWSQNGRDTALNLERKDAAALAAPPVPKELEGNWLGTLKLPNGIELRLVIRVTEGDDKTRKALMDSPDQATTDIPVSSTSLKDGLWTWEVKSLGAKFSGKANENVTEYKGEFSQGSVKAPLVLKKVKEIVEVKRPQVPKPPFPYAVEEIVFKNPAAGLQFTGTLTRPKGKDRVPAVVLITGSGPQDRDESLMGHKPFLIVADHFTRKGIAVLRYDDRGVGGSGGSVDDSTSQDFAGDVLSAVEYLKSRPDIDPKAIGLCGHSEGGLIAPIAAARSSDVAFIILMAGTGLPGDRILELQRGLILKAMGTDPAKIERAQSFSKRLIDLVRASEPSKLKDQARSLVEKLSGELTEEEKKELTEGALDSQLSAVNSKWFRAFLDYDPRVNLRKVSCPVLALNGELDLQVPPKENLAEIEKALKEAGNKDVTTREFKSLNHLFQTSKTGAPSEYAKIEETFSPAALEVMSSWMAERFLKNRAN